MISKSIVFSILALTTTMTVLIIGWSFGWYFPIFTVILIPVIIMHLMAGIKVYKNYPQLNGWMILSAFAFLAFSLFRSDVDAQGGFSGYSAMLFHLGIRETAHTESWKYSLEVTFIFLLVQIFINTYILRTKVAKKI